MIRKEDEVGISMIAAIEFGELRNYYQYLHEEPYIIYISHNPDRQSQVY